MIRGEQSNSTRDRFGDKMDDVCKLSWADRVFEINIFDLMEKIRSKLTILDQNTQFIHNTRNVS